MKCPICQEEMLKTDAPYVEKCEERRVWAPNVRTVKGIKIQTHILVVHSIIYSNPTSGRQELKVFEITPYIFRICDYENIKRTDISERVLLNLDFGEVRAEEKELMSLPVALDFPWHDEKKVLERLKMYMVFS